MEIVVQKYGGTSVADKDKLEQVCLKIIEAYNKGESVVVVVSAQGDTTDNLISNAKRYSKKKHKREMDLLLSTGEMKTVAYLTMMLKDKGYDAISLTGEQAGIITNGDYGSAKVIKVIKENIEKHINDGKIVVVTGFQGVDKFGNINTLGRGGSDLSAVAIAVALEAKECCIYTDVNGIYSADPRIIKKAKLLKNISFEEILEAATAGAKVLHNRSVGVGRIYELPMIVKSVTEEGEGTKLIHINKETDMLENYGPKIITKNDNISKITIVGDSLISYPEYINKIFKIAAEKDFQIIMITFSEISINIVVKNEIAEEFICLLHESLMEMK
ncbi:MAG: aspartate kinase [Clostridia bacterium]|nr:aspartate kinase [Clostridia bacterium]MDD4375910.1 aspartate kinase [Clostridia bacterium]